MKSLADWKVVALVLAGAIGSALFCLWLVWDRFEQAHRQHEQQLMQVAGRSVLGSMDQSIRSTRLVIDSAFTRVVTGPGLVASSKQTLARALAIVRRELERSGSSEWVSGLVLVNVTERTVLASDVAAVKVGERVADGPLNQLLDGLTSNLDHSASASARVLDGGQATELWLSARVDGRSSQSSAGAAASPAAGSGDVVLGVRVSLNQLLSHAKTNADFSTRAGVSALQAVEMSIGALESAHTRADPLDSRKAGGPVVVSGELSRVQPALELTVRSAGFARAGVVGPIAWRLLTGASLLSALLGALAWRWQRNAGVAQKKSRATLLRRVRASADVILQRSSALGVRAASIESFAQQQRQVLDDAIEQLSSAATEVRAAVASGQSAHDDISGALQASTDNGSAAQRTVAGLDKARTQVRQTEKRLKGLAERSQEISSVVKAIAELAQRTGILALNVSLQAAAAGETGKQFVPLADELRRLADSARDATEQVSGLVQAIRDETTQASQATAQAISAVVAVTEAATKGAEVARESVVSIDRLRGSVSTIASLAADQRSISELAESQLDEVAKTQKQLAKLMRAQLGDATELDRYARQLLDHANPGPASASPRRQP